jgi:Tol biopolymer transport system component
MTNRMGLAALLLAVAACGEAGDQANEHERVVRPPSTSSPDGGPRPDGSPDDDPGNPFPDWEEERAVPVPPVELSRFDFVYMGYLGGADGALMLGNLAGESRFVRFLDGGIASSGHLAAAPHGDRVLFLSFDYGVTSSWELRVVDLSDGHEKQLATGLGHSDPSPTWSPDGRQVAFSTYDSVQLVSADGFEAAQTIATESACGPVEWSADGRELLWTNGEEILGYDVASGARRVIVGAKAERSYCEPHYSPAGDEVAFTSANWNETVPTGEIDVVPVGGGEPTRLAELEDPFTNPLRWRPDGQALDYQDYDDAISDGVIREVARTGGAPVVIDSLDSGIHSDAPVWSRDGSLMIYTRWQPPGDAVLWTYDPATGERRALGITTTSIDSSYVSFLADDAGEPPPN